MRYCFDIDGTICTNTNGKYADAEPYHDMIDVINELYDAGHYIIFHTARGMGKHNGVPNKAATDWYHFTQDQLHGWAVQFHELHLGKILADVYFDDKGFRLNEDGSGVEAVKKFLGV